MNLRPKILQIGNYPPPLCGWAIQTKLVAEELRRRGYICEILKINENRKIKDSAYVDVQNGWDYLWKVAMHALRGYRLNIHVNGQSKPGYVLALIAVLAGRMVGRPALITFHGGLSQAYFPRHDSRRLYWAFRLLFLLAGGIACDDAVVKQAVEAYGISPSRVVAIATFSGQYLSFQPVTLESGLEKFLAEHRPVFFSYVSFRPEYQLEVVRDCMRRFRERYPDAGFLWLGFPAKEFPLAEAWAGQWTDEERAGLYLLGNLDHDAFLTLMSRCSTCLRTPACDGVAASVLEALALGIPVVASENGRRPEGVITYQEKDARDMCAKLIYVTEHSVEVKARLRPQQAADNVARMADWLLAGELPVPAQPTNVKAAVG
jgi:glycosyltransferase involved in cell wall biosynthesis